MSFKYANILFPVRNKNNDKTCYSLIRNNKLFNTFYIDSHLKEILACEYISSLDKKLEVTPMQTILFLYKKLFDSKDNKLVDESKYKLDNLIDIGNFLERIFLAEKSSKYINFKYKIEYKDDGKFNILLDIDCDSIFDFPKTEKNLTLDTIAEYTKIFNILNTLQKMFNKEKKYIPNNFSEVIHNETLKMLIKSYLTANFDKVFNNKIFNENFYPGMYLISVNILDFNCELISKQCFYDLYKYDQLYDNLDKQMFRSKFELVFGTFEDREKSFFNLEDFSENGGTRSNITITKIDSMDKVRSPSDASGEVANIRRLVEESSGTPQIEDITVI